MRRCYEYARGRWRAICLCSATLLSVASCSVSPAVGGEDRSSPPVVKSVPIAPSIRATLAAGAHVPKCRPSELVVSVRWKRSGSGLLGKVLAENTGPRTCRVGSKPMVVPMGSNGPPLPVENVQTTELRIPPYVVLRPGQRAAAPAGWGSWCGTPASGRALVGWDGGSTVVHVFGPRTPACLARAPKNLSTSWFSLVR